MSEIRWDDYRDSLGFLSGKKAPQESSGNAVLFAAHEKRLRILLSDWSDRDNQALISRVVAYLEVEPGLLKRPAPFSHDVESMDNYVGYATLRQSFAWSALIYGMRSYYRPLPFVRLRYQYAIDKRENEPRAWLGRYPALIAHMKYCAGERPNAIEQAFWNASVAFSGDGTHQDPWILNWHLVTSAPECRSARVYWRRLAHNWPGGLAQVFGEYLDDYDHPIVQACEKLALGKTRIA